MTGRPTPSSSLAFDNSITFSPGAEGQERRGERNGRQANEQMGNCMKKRAGGVWGEKML